jgi:hypothetical protein
MSDRRIDCFFYGLFMDVDVLRRSNVVPGNPRRAYVEGFALRIGRRATLVPSPGARVYGMVIELTHAELERLYTAPDLEEYRPEAVLAHPLAGTTLPAPGATSCRGGRRCTIAIRSMRRGSSASSRS